MAIINVGYTELFITLKMDSFGSEHSRKKIQKFIQATKTKKQICSTTTHFLLHCPNHHCARKTLFDKINIK